MNPTATLAIMKEIQLCVFYLEQFIRYDHKELKYFNPPHHHVIYEQGRTGIP
jgi:hypothetical protein